MQTRKKLRSPFVVTLAASAAAVLDAGCGANVVTGNPPPTTESCPASLPQQGAACDPASVPDHCGYGSTPGCAGLPQHTAFCDADTNAWRVIPSSCNPPPVQTCPQTAPTDGTFCYSDIRCTYGDCDGRPTTEASCSGNRWSVTTSTCNPPPPMCPAATPAQGAACDPATVPGSCQYRGTFCPYPPPGTDLNVVALCIPTTRTWQVSVASCNPPPPVCPSSPPEAGANCLGAPPLCSYDSCATPRGVASARCVSGRWELGYGSCNPPPLMCPSEVPMEGSPCAAVPPACHWGDCDGRPTARGVCESGRWRVDHAECVRDGGVEPPDSTPDAGAPDAG